MLCIGSRGTLESTGRFQYARGCVRSQVPDLGIPDLRTGAGMQHRWDRYRLTRTTKAIHAIGIPPGLYRRTSKSLSLTPGLQF